MILHFANARLIDPEAGTDATGSLSVKDGLILARDEKTPKGALLIDCQGSYSRVGFKRIADGERVMSLIRQVPTGVA